MFLIGLTGGIAAGKSTVAEFWKSLGAFEIDADLLAREVIAPGSPGLKAVVDYFGNIVMNKDGSLDRSSLGKIIFENSEKRTRLEQIVHPLVQKRAKELLVQHAKEKFVIYNVPLLVEANVELPFNAVVTVEAPESVRVDRLMTERGMSKAEATQRISAQASPAERVNRADYILNSNQPLALMLKDAEQLWNRFQKEANGTN